MFLTMLEDLMHNQVITVIKLRNTTDQEMITTREIVDQILTQIRTSRKMVAKIVATDQETDKIGKIEIGMIETTTETIDQTTTTGEKDLKINERTTEMMILNLDLLGLILCKGEPIYKCLRLSFKISNRSLSTNNIKFSTMRVLRKTSRLTKVRMLSSHLSLNKCSFNNCSSNSFRFIKGN